MSKNIQDFLKLTTPFGEFEHSHIKILDISEEDFFSIFGPDNSSIEFFTKDEVDEIIKDLIKEGFSEIESKVDDGGYYFNLYENGTKIGHISIHRKMWTNLTSVTGSFHAKNETKNKEKVEEKEKKGKNPPYPHLRVRIRIKIEEPTNNITEPFAFINFAYGTENRIFESNIKQGETNFTQIKFAIAAFRIINKVLSQKGIKLSSTQHTDLLKAGCKEQKELTDDVIGQLTQSKHEEKSKKGQETAQRLKEKRKYEEKQKMKQLYNKVKNEKNINSFFEKLQDSFLFIEKGEKRTQTKMKNTLDRMMKFAGIEQKGGTRKRKQFRKRRTYKN